MSSDDDLDFDASSIDEDDDASSFHEENDHPNKKTSKSKQKSNKKSASPAAPAATKKKGSKTIEETYQKKTQLEHILLRPDTYIGSTEPLQSSMFVLDSSKEKIIQREITYTPGLYKIFDEILVNAADNKQRDPNMDRLEITVDAERGVISVLNNGKGIPVVRHKEHKCYVPTLIFGELLTGSNFDDNEKKTTGGRNGYGAKLTNIFSTKFTIECVDTSSSLKFHQTFRNNMTTIQEPVITKCTSSEKKNGDYVKITFWPDLKRFHMDSLDEDTVSLLSKRAYDIAGSMGNSGGKRLQVHLNGRKIPVKDFKSYLSLYEGIPPPEAYEKVGRWEVGISVSDGTFNQVSFVNAIASTKGGGHVDYISDLVAKNLMAAVKKKNKGGSEIKLKQIKNHLCVFVNCLVENPTFDSQTKENLTTRPASFKKEVQLSDKFLKQVEKCGVVDAIVAYGKFKEKQSLQRKNGTKKSKLTGITKLDDANFAGTAKSKDCTLIITEGDSAKSLAVSGLSVVGRDFYGVFPLKGKPLNVRDATSAQVKKNEEIMNLVEIMGLKFGTVYTPDNIKSLRYGHLMIMADQDHDGSHIKGLIINFIHHFWPSLLDIPNFLMQFITPIVKCTKGKKTHTFFTLPEYEEWKEGTGNEAKGWTIKYYKGLGTSTSGEAKEYFSNLDIHEIHFNELTSDIITIDDGDMEDIAPDTITSGAGLIDMAFSKSKVEARKQWLNSIEKNTFLNYSNAQRYGVDYSEFINRELILFSQYDNVRSIPNIMDGLKPSQRKVLYACFKKKLKTEIKVAQLAGYIGEHSAYHHGEMSLTGAIIGMAQSYCGSNNINLLYPSGQFGTRRMGGKDHASARYIFTRLEKIARTIFHPDDDALLNYLNDDGLSVEPEYYMPVIPMVLVNGSDGIGTGYSSTIQTHDPRDIIANIRKMLNDKEPEIMHPYFSGFTGEIIAENGKKEGSYTVKGKIERIDDTTLLITELPVGKWTQDYKSFLEGMMTGTDKNPGEITDFKENHTDTTVSFTVISTEAKINEFEKGKGGLYAKFKLSTSISTKNMTAFDTNGKIHKYSTNLDILKVFFEHRLEYYVKRKELLLEKMRRELKILDNKARFVEEVCSGDLVVSSRKRKELLADLKERGYELFPKEDKKTGYEDEDAEEEEVDESASDAELAKGYQYLLGMSIWSLTFEKAAELRRQLAEKHEEVNTLETTKPESIWLNDMDAIEEVLDERDVEMDAEAKREKQAQSKAKVRVAKAATKKAKKSKKKKDEWDSDLEDSDEDENIMVISKPKPAPKRKTQPKKQAISLGDFGFTSKKNVPAKTSARPESSNAESLSEESDVDAAAEKKKVPSKKKKPIAAKAKGADTTVGKRNKSICELSDNDDEVMSDFEDDNPVDSSTDRKPETPSSRSRRSRANVSYVVDGSSDEELNEEEGEDDEDEEMLSADEVEGEHLEPDVDEGEDIEPGTTVDSPIQIDDEDDVKPSKTNKMLIDEWDRDLEDSDEKVSLASDSKQDGKKRKTDDNDSESEQVNNKWDLDPEERSRDSDDDVEFLGSDHEAKQTGSAKQSKKKEKSKERSWDFDPEDSGDDEDFAAPKHAAKKKPTTTKPNSKKVVQRDEWDLDFDDSGDEKRTFVINDKRSSKNKPKKAKVSEPDPKRVLKPLAVDKDALLDSQSVDSLSPVKKKKSSKTTKKKTAPKRKSPIAAKNKLTSKKKKSPVKKPAKKLSKSMSVCNLSSDDEDIDDFFDADDSVAANSNNVESDGSEDIVMEEVTPRGGRRSRGKVSYAEEESSESEKESDEDSDIEFD